MKRLQILVPIVCLALLAACSSPEERAAKAQERSYNSQEDVARQRLELVEKYQDCVDEAANSTSYLLLLEQNGLLRHHRTAPPDIRGFFLDGRYQHYAAVIQDQSTGAPWVVDSWVRDNGQPPVMAPLSQWRASYGGL